MTPDDALPLDTVLDGNFRITAVLGRGGFGITYKAVDLRLDVVRVIKEYFPFGRARRSKDGTVGVYDANDQEDFDWGLQRWRSVGTSLASLKHPAIAGILSLFEQNGTLYSVFEFIEGDTLEQLSRKSALPSSALTTLAIQLLEALDYIHARGVLHLDITPDHIIVRPDGTPALAGFSMGLQQLGDLRLRHVPYVRPGFSPLEAFAPDGKLLGPPADLYALGATLYCLVAGAPPPSALDRLMDGDDAAPARAAGEGRYSHEVLTFIDAALRLPIKERPQSASAMRDILRDAAFEQAPRSPPMMAAPEARSAPTPADEDENSHAFRRPVGSSVRFPRERRGKTLGIVRDPSTPVSAEALAERRQLERIAGESKTAPVSVTASVFAPARMRARATALIQVFLHAPADAGRAAGLATAIDPARGRQITRDLDLPLRAGDKVQVTYECIGLELTPQSSRSQVITWTGQPRSVNFEVQAPFTVFGRTHRPVVNVTRLGDVPISLGHIQFSIEVGLRAPRTEAGFTGEARRHGRAFLSYSAEDRIEVLKRAQAFRAAGVEIFQDILELTPGERWERSLYGEIDRADVFYLFWSAAARRSKWVRKEARQALKRQQGPGSGVPSIVPIVLESPPPAAPRFLRHIHFNDPIGVVIAGQTATERR